MEKTRNSQELQQKFAEFELQNPKVAEAMRLFGFSVEKYYDALHAMNAPRLYVSNSTTSRERKQHGELG